MRTWYDHVHCFTLGAQSTACQPKDTPCMFIKQINEWDHFMMEEKVKKLKKRGGGIILKNRQGQKEEKSKRKNMVWFVKNTGVVPSCLQLSACSWRLKRFWLQGIPRSLIPSAAPELSGNSLPEGLSLEQLVSSFTVGKTKTNARQRTGWEVWWYAQQTGGHKIEEALILLEDLGGE